MVQRKMWGWENAFFKMKDVIACQYTQEKKLLEGKIGDAESEKRQLLEQCF